MALTVLQWVLGIVILAEAVRFVMPAAAHDFARTHLPGIVRLVLGWGEIIGCIFLLIPPTAIRGAWMLVAIFTLAIVIHLLHGMYGVGNLVIYSAAAFAVATGKGN
jgi:type II secretory pathway component PulF